MSELEIGNKNLPQAMQREGGHDTLAGLRYLGREAQGAAGILWEAGKDGMRTRAVTTAERVGDAVYGVLREGVGVMLGRLLTVGRRLEELYLQVTDARNGNPTFEELFEPVGDPHKSVTVYVRRNSLNPTQET